MKTIDDQALEHWFEYAAYQISKGRPVPKMRVAIATIRGPYLQAITIFRDVTQPKYIIHKSPRGGDRGRIYPLSATSAEEAIAEAIRRHPKGKAEPATFNRWWKV